MQLLIILLLEYLLIPLGLRRWYLAIQQYCSKTNVSDQPHAVIPQVDFCDRIDKNLHPVDAFAGPACTFRSERPCVLEELPNSMSTMLELSGSDVTVWGRQGRLCAAAHASQAVTPAQQCALK